MKNNIGQIYIIGDLLNKGSVLLREKEAKELRERGFEVYSAIEDKSINDKSAHTVESNNRLHERIYTKDMNALYKSKTIIATPETFALGSICELGGMEVFNHLHDIFSSILTDDLTDTEKLNKLNEFLSNISTSNPNVLAIFSAKKLLGFLCPLSIYSIILVDTPTISANSDCFNSNCFRYTCIHLRFIITPRNELR